MSVAFVQLLPQPKYFVIPSKVIHLKKKTLKYGKVGVDLRKNKQKNLKFLHPDTNVQNPETAQRLVQ